MQSGHVSPCRHAAPQLPHHLVAGQLAPGQALPHQPAQLKRALARQSHQPALVFDCAAQVLAERGKPLFAAQLIERSCQRYRCDVMHPAERIEVRDRVTVQPCLAGLQQKVLEGVLQGRGEQLQVLLVDGLAIRQSRLLAHLADAPLCCRAVVLRPLLVLALSCKLLVFQLQVDLQVACRGTSRVAGILHIRRTAVHRPRSQLATCSTGVWSIF